MMNEELKAKIEALNSMEDAYALVKADGYTGTMDEFVAMCEQAAKDMSMNVDDMDAVAGGVNWESLKDDASEALSKTLNWIKENPVATAGIVGGTAVAVAGVVWGVKHFSAGNQVAGNNEPLRDSLADIPGFQPPVINDKTVFLN